MGHSMALSAAHRSRASKCPAEPVPGSGPAARHSPGAKTQWPKGARHHSKPQIHNTTISGAVCQAVPRNVRKKKKPNAFTSERGHLLLAKMSCSKLIPARGCTVGVVQQVRVVRGSLIVEDTHERSKTPPTTVDCKRMLLWSMRHVPTNHRSTPQRCRPSRPASGRSGAATSHLPSRRASYRPAKAKQGSFHRTPPSGGCDVLYFFVFVTPSVLG